jgi:SAM-dependent methyltransferase
MSLPGSYFDDLYADAVEVGCTQGELSAALAQRCDRLTAWDVSAAAVEQTRQRTAGLPGVRVEQRGIPVDPLPPCDLVVLSEVLYYLDPGDLRAAVATVRAAVRPGGTVLAVHWRHPVADYPQTGDAVHAVLRQELDFSRVAVHEEADFLLDCWVAAPATDRRAGSVAAAEELW